MSKLSQLASLPEGSMVPADRIREALEEDRRESVSLAVEGELTVHMWSEIATRHYCEQPEATERIVRNLAALEDLEDSWEEASSDRSSRRSRAETSGLSVLDGTRGPGRTSRGTGA